MRSISSLDLKFIVKDLQILLGGRIQKIFQKEKEIRMQIFVSGAGNFELLYDPGKFFLTKYKRVSEEIGSFAMFLRKHLGNEKINSIKQKGFERIVEIETDNNILIFEIFSKGNVILCSKDYEIIMPLENQNWKDRTVRPKVKYAYPPAVRNPFEIKEEELEKLINESKKELVKFIAADLSLSGMYAEEVCARAGIDKNIICEKLKPEELEKIFEAIKSLESEYKPQLVSESGAVIDFIPFDIEIYNKDKEKQAMQSFTEVLDEYFSKAEENEAKKTMPAMEKLNRMLSDQAKTKEKWERIEKECKEKAEAVQRNFGIVENIINGIEKAKQTMEWKELKERILNEETGEAHSIKEIQEKDGKIILELD